MGTVSRSFRTLFVTIVAGGVAVGACLAALIPGTVELATAHHYTADSEVNLRQLDQQSTVYAADGSVMGYARLATSARSSRSTRSRSR